MRRITWTSDGLPASISTTGHTTQMRYDADGTLVQEIRDRRATDIVGSLAERSASGQFTDFVYADGKLLAQNQAGRRRWYTVDPAGSPRLVTDSGGTPIARLDYAAFGEPTSTMPGSTSIGYGGHRRIGTGALIDMGSRYYDPQIQTMLSADTVIPDPSQPLALNPYIYAYNDPLAYNDPTGHTPEALQPVPAGPIVPLATSDAWFAPEVNRLAANSNPESSPWHEGQGSGDYAALAPPLTSGLSAIATPVTGAESADTGDGPLLPLGGDEGGGGPGEGADAGAQIDPSDPPVVVNTQTGSMQTVIFDTPPPQAPPPPALEDQLNSGVGGLAGPSGGGSGLGRGNSAVGQVGSQGGGSNSAGSGAGPNGGTNGIRLVVSRHPAVDQGR